MKNTEPVSLSQRRYRYRSETHLRRLLHALLSALLPGAGQLAAGARQRAFFMLGALALPLLVCGVVIANLGFGSILQYLIQPRFLLMLLGLNGALLAFRLFAVVDAYRIGRTKAGHAIEISSFRVAAGGAALALLLLLTAAPHAITGYYTYLSHDLLTGDVFAGGGGAEPTSVPNTAAPPTIPEAAPETGAAPETSTTQANTGRESSNEESPVVAASGLEWGEDQRLSILLLGTDAGYGREGARADAIMVATVDLREGHVALFGIPRNTGNLPLGERAAAVLGTSVYPDMIGNLYGAAGGYEELAPNESDPGAEVLREVAGTLLGIPIDYYAVVDMGGFVDLVNAFGGLTINVKEPINVRLSPPREGEQYVTYNIPSGKQELDGHEALAFARSRTGNSDYDRMRRQRCVLKALLYQNGAAELALKLPDVIAVVRDNLKTDIPTDSLPELVDVRAELGAGKMLTVGFTPPDFVSRRNELGYNVLDEDLVRSTVREAIEDPDRMLEQQGGSGTNVDTSDCWKVE